MYMYTHNLQQVNHEQASQYCTCMIYLQVKHVVLINCGANFDIIETLQPEEYVKFYICDRSVLLID